MKIIVFISLVTIEMLFLPDAFIYMFVKYFIPISDDGEYAMDSFELTVLLVKAFMCAVGAGVAITLFRTH